MTSTHWMTRVVARAGFPGADRLDLKADHSVEEVWQAAMETCGVTEAELAAQVAAQFRTEVADFETAVPTATKLIPESVARRYLVYPLQDRDRYLVVATADPVDVQADQEIGFASGRTPKMHIAPPSALHLAIDGAYSPEQAAASLLSGLDADLDALVEVVEAEETKEHVSAEDTAAGPVVRLASTILHQAITRGASDIHIQPTPTGGVVRFRVDGVLRTGMQLPLPVLVRVVSRIKVLSQLDIADRLRPQDGRTRIAVNGLRYDLRVSTVPTRHAEKCVIRVLDPGQSGTLDETGIHAGDVAKIRRVLSQRDGIFVVTGPTGSGKTTTLYGALREISTEDVNVMTVEDPVEFELPGLTQIQVETKQGVTFASALRAILRQDPDVIFVGEIRDTETAGIAAQASLTGHLVLATLHTNDAVGSIRRFVDLGLDPAALTETLRGALAQRLVRRVCKSCSVPAEAPLTEDEVRLSDAFGAPPVVRAVGCATCSDAGYAGRLPLTEFMSMTPELAGLVLAGAAPAALHEQAERDGMETLLESALRLVASGETTLDEVERVLGEVERQAPKEAAATRPPAAPAVPSPAPPTPDSSTPTAPPAAAIPEPPPSAPADEVDAEAPHILVVDDDGVNRSIARGLLQKEGYRVTEVGDGSEALVLLARGDLFNLMVLDLDMPMLGGREVLAAVRRSVTTAGLPVVVLTGTRDPDSEIELMENGADDYIRKPIDPPRFLTRVKATLRRAGA